MTLTIWYVLGITQLMSYLALFVGYFQSSSVEMTAFLINILVNRRYVQLLMNNLQG